MTTKYDLHVRIAGELGIAFADRAMHSSDIAGQSEPPDDITEFAIALRCAQKGCSTHVEVLAPMIACRDKSQARDRVPGLIDSRSLKCELGFPLQNPPNVVGLL